MWLCCAGAGAEGPFGLVFWVTPGSAPRVAQGKQKDGIKQRCFALQCLKPHLLLAALPAHAWVSLPSPQPLCSHWSCSHHSQPSRALQSQPKGHGGAVTSPCGVPRGVHPTGSCPCSRRAPLPCEDSPSPVTHRGGQRPPRVSPRSPRCLPSLQSSIISPKSCGSRAQRAPSPFQLGPSPRRRSLLGSSPLSPLLTSLPTVSQPYLLLSSRGRRDKSNSYGCFSSGGSPPSPLPPPASPCSVQIKGEDQAHVIFFVQNQYSAKFICPT